MFTVHTSVRFSRWLERGFHILNETWVYQEITLQSKCVQMELGPDCTVVIAKCKNVIAMTPHCRPAQTIEA